MPEPRDLKWSRLNNIEARSYTCGYCGHGVGPDRGYFAENRSDYRVYICSYCRRPTFIEPEGTQYPGVAYGTAVSNLPPEVSKLYDEARNAMSVNAYTAAVMACRKVLMNVAVAEGAPTGKRFADYVKWLGDQGFVPAKGRSWVDRIRKKGNEANHEIPDVERADAEDIITFTEMLLKVNYEMPARAESPDAAQADEPDDGDDVAHIETG